MNLLIVDDQKDVVNGLINGLSFQQIGIDGAYGAFSAAGARDIMENVRIDIILCDIEMPVESGLSFIKWVRERDFKCECIFLTSHAEFDYAKEAVSLESFEYILQPARYEVIEETVRRAVQRRKEKLNIETIQRTQKYENEMYHKAADDYLWDLMNGAADAATVLSDIFQLKLQNNNIARGIHVSLVQAAHKNEGDKSPDPGLVRAGISSVLQAVSDVACQKIVLLRYIGDKYILIQVDAPETPVSDETCKDTIAAYLNAETELPFVTTFYFYGSVPDPSQLRQIITEMDLFSDENVMLRRGIIDYGSRKEEHFHEKYKNLINTSRWPKLLLQGRGGEIIEMVRVYFETENPGKEALSYVQKQFEKIYLSVLSGEGMAYDEIFDTSFTMNRLVERVGEFRKLEQIMDTAVARLNDRFAQRDSGGQEERVSDQIIAYIHDNMGEDLSRTAIAERFGFHKDSLTRVFKSETGYNLKEYIIQEKISYAKRLLNTTDLTVGMIAVEAGFNNFSHFCMVFKKLEGTTPSDYRNQK